VRVTSKDSLISTVQGLSVESITPLFGNSFPGLLNLLESLSQLPLLELVALDETPVDFHFDANVLTGR
jgi:hypothetical protein